jgi:hypothetical protein
VGLLLGCVLFDANCRLRRAFEVETRAVKAERPAGRASALY